MIGVSELLLLLLFAIVPFALLIYTILLFSRVVRAAERGEV